MVLLVCSSLSSSSKYLSSYLLRGRSLQECQGRKENRAHQGHSNGVGITAYAGTAAGRDVVISHQRCVDYVDNTVGTLDVRSKHRDPLASFLPLNEESSIFLFHSDL